MTPEKATSVDVPQQSTVDEVSGNPSLIFNPDVGVHDSPYEARDIALGMQARCRLLLDEVEEFESYLKQQKKEHNVEIRTFKGGLQAEMKLINKLTTADPNDPKTSHALRSSNLAFYAGVWATAKFCTDVTALGQRFYGLPGKAAAYSHDTKSVNGINSSNKSRSNGALVDIVAQNGLEWIKVSSITEKRIIWDLAKSGWADSSSDEDEDGNEAFDDDDDDPQGLVKQAEALLKASNATRVRYRRPKVRIVLPRIKAVPDSKQVAKVLQKVRDLGVLVQTLEDIPSESPPVATVLDRLTTSRFQSFSEILNIDCTILLAFISDLSHGRVESQDWHNKAIARQIEMEREDQLMPNSLWPACGSKEMVCTREAAVRMQEIVDIIGTESEKKRASLLLDLGGKNHVPREELLQEFQKLSDYTIPSDWALPIEVKDVDLDSLISDLPPVAQKVSDVLTPINRSVFLFGWSTGMTIISSNGTVAKEIETTIEEYRTSDETIGPDIWLSPSSRSLVGKEKQRRGFDGNTA